MLRVYKIGYTTLKSVSIEGKGGNGMYKRKSEIAKKGFILAICIGAIYTILLLYVFKKDEFLKTFTTIIAIPAILDLIKISMNDIKDSSDTNYLVNRLEELHDKKIINDNEYRFRKKELIELENKQIDRNHEDDKNKEYYKININK